MSAEQLARTALARITDLRNRLGARLTAAESNITSLAGTWTEYSGSGNVTMASNWTFVDLDAWRCGDFVQFRLAAERDTSALAVNSTTGDTTNTDVATLSSDLRGSLNLGLSCGGGGTFGRMVSGVFVPSSGLIQVTASTSDADIAVGENVTFGGMFYVG